MMHSALVIAGQGDDAQHEGDHMETMEYRTFDKSEWGAGDWNGEPDKKQWLDPETGYPCLIVRNRGGSLCGYVGVPRDHPLYEKDYEDVDVDVHGGLTFAEACAAGGDESRHICHKTDGDDHVWWFGFDCAHYLDVSPARVARDKDRGWRVEWDAAYRNFAYVTKEVESLARQLKAVT